MTAHRAPVESPRPAGSPTSQPDAARALGEALDARSDDFIRICEGRLETLNLAARSEAYRAERRSNLELGFRLMARWLRTGEESTPEEREQLGSIGREAAQTDVSIAQMTRGYLIWRDVVQNLIKEEADRLESPREVVATALRMTAASCDSSILRMTEVYDRQKELNAAELAASEARFRGVFESMATGVILVGPDGTVVSCNEAAAAMLGIPVDSLLGANACATNPHYSDEQGVMLQRMPIPAVLETGRPIHGLVVKHDFGDGRPVRWHQLDAVPIVDAEGNLAQVLATFSDVTAVKEAEAIRAESEAKDRFLATVSHELRTPLNSILGFAQLLETQGTGKLDEKQLRYVHNIARSGAGLLQLISDVLALTSSSGQPAAMLGDVAVAPLAREVATEFEPELERRPVKLVTRLEAGLRARADRARLRQVLANLIANAVKFTSEGSITITSARVDGKVVIRVDDTGIGIPPEQLERVFSEFTQVDGSATRAHGGVGLGLAVSRRLLEQMGGRIHLESGAEGGLSAIVELQPA